MRPTTLFIIALFANLTFSFAQSNPGEEQKPTIALLGTFHFAGSSDLIALDVKDLKTDKRQGEIQDLVTALAKFKPTKIILEYPYQKNRLDSLYQEYREGEHQLSINERQQLGFRLAKELGHNHIYPADHHLDLPFDELMAFLEENERMNEFQAMMEYMKSEVMVSMQNAYDSASLKEFFVWLNSDRSDKMNKNLYMERINKMGAENNYIGSDVVSKWWERNFKIMRNIDEIMEPNDRVLVLFGQGHTSLLKDFYRDRDDVIYTDILDYLKD
ncbi:DUF5694 domain-containing protein [Poritiphilus flavus]|uniref:TraB/GumN family protein n=1 Tax=Poritiphilus flavus TaxID=2697053 RepID=A0A6L9EI01_9FLAO|nr:DUF5694 domain-containing protein [Poritiphilus flavus]NAS14424.1 hypothetical protein [Poritiphilus flavus]